MKTSGIKILIILAFVISLSGCCRKKYESSNMGLKATDRFFSKMSETSGRNAAFLAMFDSAGVMMRENGMPVQGIGAIRALLIMKPDTSYTLKWEPLFADSSGNLGYTYGTWNLTTRKTAGLLGEGTYTTIWKRDSKGEWKAVLDTGNDGPKEK